MGIGFGRVNLERNCIVFLALYVVVGIVCILGVVVVCCSLSLSSWIQMALEIKGVNEGVSM